MKISMNAGNVFDKYGYEKGLVMLKNAGFDCCDYSFCAGGSSSYHVMFTGDDYLELAAKIKKCADEVGISFNQAHAPFPSGIEGDKEKSEEIFVTIIRSIEAAAVMGAKCIVVHPLRFADYGTHYEENMAFYKRIIPYAQKAGIKIGIENQWGMDKKRDHTRADALASAEELKRFVSELGEWAVICLDVGHSILSGFEAADEIRVLGKDLYALHVHDTNYQRDWHQLPYQGNHDWEGICKALKDAGYEGEFTLEVNRFTHLIPDGLYDATLKYMAEVARYLASQSE